MVTTQVFAVGSSVTRVQASAFAELRVTDELASVPETKVGKVQPLGCGPLAVGSWATWNLGRLATGRCAATMSPKCVIAAQALSRKTLQTIITKKGVAGGDPPRTIAAPADIANATTS